MIKSFYDFKYCIWQIDLSDIKLNTHFDLELNDAFTYASMNSPNPNEAIGNAYSVMNMYALRSYNEFIRHIFPTATLYYEKITGQKINGVNRCWANRMHEGSTGAVHTHPKNVKVLNLYYNIPTGSSDLVFVNPSYITTETNPNLIPESEKFNIKVFEGMCILYDSEIPHGVSSHRSNQTRDTIILEFF